MIRSRPGAALTWLGLGLAVTALYLCLGPVAVNGDGIGYLKAARDGVVYPGHPAYVALLAWSWRLARAIGWTGSALAGGIAPGRLLSAISAGLCAAVLGALVERRTGERRRGMCAALGLCASSGFLLVGTDLESYAPAIAMLLLTLACLDRGRAVGAGLCLAFAVLLHVENLLFFAPALLSLRGARARAILLVVAAPLVGLGLVLAQRAGGVPAATHGFHYPLHVYTPAVALWGALRSLVYAPYPYEAAWPTVVITTSLGAAGAGALAVLCGRGYRAGRRLDLPRGVVAAWVLPYAAVGAAFFASDSERWIFLLPLVWLAAATWSKPRALAGVILAVAVSNALCWIPAAQDGRGIARARAVAATLHAGDLVISPGHGWDESIPLYADGVVPFPLVFFAAARGPASLPAALDEAIAAAHRRGKDVRVVRVDDVDDPSGTLGYKELAGMGIDRAAVRALLAKERR